MIARIGNVPLAYYKDPEDRAHLRPLPMVAGPRSWRVTWVGSRLTAASSSPSRGSGYCINTKGEGLPRKSRPR
ncbi:MAG: hypothetical protein R2709_00290 [Marmoricola sp.]